MSLKARLSKLEPKAVSTIVFRKTIYENKDGSAGDVRLRAVILGPNLSVPMEAHESEEQFRLRVQQISDRGQP